MLNYVLTRFGVISDSMRAGWLESK